MQAKALTKGVAIVTGAAGGMGAATVRQLSDAGYLEFILCDVNTEKLEALATPLRKQGMTVNIIAGDIADVTFPDQLLAVLAERPIAVVVHTAGISPAMGTPERILAINLDASIRLVEAIYDYMAPNSAAVLFASNSSYFPMPPDAAEAFTSPLPKDGTSALLQLAPTPELAYPLSKLGVRALVKREAKRFGERGARLVSLSPGAIDTPMTQREGLSRGTTLEASMVETESIAQRMIRNSATGRMGDAEELAAVVVFLCSPAASFITACDILVDGGQTAAMGF